MTRRTEWSSETETAAPAERGPIPEDWRDDASCEDLMKALLQFKGHPRYMEAQHLSYLQYFGDSYRYSDFAGTVRELLYEATGREVS